MEELIERGIRLTLDAGKLLEERKDEQLLQEIIKLNKPLVTKEDIERLIVRNEKVEVIAPSYFKPTAKEYSTNIKVLYKRDVTGKSRSRGEIGDFINCFRNRYVRLARMLHGPTDCPTVELSDIKRHIGERVKVIVAVREKRETKKGNILLEIEDLTGTFKAVVGMKSKEGGQILLDDVIALTGKVLEPYMIVDSIKWPDMPITRSRRLADVDVAVVYLSDLHFGSRYFLEHPFNTFIDWLHGKSKNKELAGKVKYIIIAGDVVDGIGIYPNQEKELIVKDIYKQYEMFDDFVASLPEWISVIVAPGNHDSVRRGEPMPAIGSDLIKSDVIRVGNPAAVVIEGVTHTIYHGTSLDSLIAALPDASYTRPERVMVEYLRRRHLSPIYGGNLIVPENVDYLVLEEEPDVLHCGHVHRNGYIQYRSTLLINSGTFQGRTEYQIKQGHVPTPALVPMYELKGGRLRTLDFKSG